MCSVPDDTKKAYTLRGGRMSTKMCKWKDLYLFLPTMFFAGRVSSPRLPRHTTIRIEMWKIQKLFSVILDGCLFTASRKKWYAELMWMVQNLIYFYCILRDGHNFRNSENMHSIEDCNDLVIEFWTLRLSIPSPKYSTAKLPIIDELTSI